jgi:hypothetical protein
LSPDALMALRQRSVLVGLVRNIFDDDLADLLRRLIDTIDHAAQVAKNDPDSIAMLLKGLTRIEGAAGNVRGAMFELIVGHYFARDGRWIDIRKTFREENKQGEIDVFAMKPRVEAVFVECRGKSSSAVLTEPEVHKWLADRIPLIRSHYLQIEDFPQAHLFELWTTGTIDPTALVELERAKKETKKYKIDFLDRDRVIERLKVAKLTKLVEMVEEHYPA